MSKPIITIFDDEDNEIKLPTKWAICGTCNGEGRHSQRFGAMTESEFYGPDWDCDSREAYMRGDYDAACEDCDGSGKVKVVNREALGADQLAALEKAEDDDYEWRAEIEAERRMGC